MRDAARPKDLIVGFKKREAMKAGSERRKSSEAKRNEKLSYNTDFAFTASCSCRKVVESEFPFNLFM